ncbi:major facilitator superfamily-domain-containing protein [Neurospora hispaniola]|uniref:Major facilitator superfamily-domain-containing protein n=1 Tax=Neurospora hispaniola TaxID=588809 RepID=A0AAJ0I8Y7_9PEZI|nr:major facilitator superfamily-domain-containing protein [Neurospora hispaniola]
MSTSDRYTKPRAATMAQRKHETIAPSAGIPPPQRKRTGLSLIHEVVLVFVLCLAQFLSLAAMNQTVAPMLILAKYFDIHDYGNLSWFSAAYSMTVGTFMLPSGRLGDIHGHKLIVMIGWAWFSLWSLVCGSCGPTNLIWFSTCRAFQGMGPALIIPNALAIIGRTLSIGLKRNLAFACFGAAGPSGAAAGAILSSLVAQKLSWHWCFWFLSMTCAVLVMMSWFIIPLPSSESPSARSSAELTTSMVAGRDLDHNTKAETEGSQQRQEPTFDTLGAITGVTGLVLVNLALNQAPLVGWHIPYIRALLVLGLLSLLAFVCVERRFATHPIVPLRGGSGLQPHAAFVLAIVFTGWSSHGIWVYYLYIFLEHLRGHSALFTSFETSPVAATGIFFALLTVYLLRRGVSVSLIMFIAMFFFFLGTLLLALTPLHQTYWANTFVAVLLMPGAMNLSFPAATILLSEQLPREKQGMAASLVATVVNYSISCGLGLAGSIHKHALVKAGDRAGVERNGRKPGPALSETSEVRRRRSSGERMKGRGEGGDKEQKRGQQKELTTASQDLEVGVVHTTRATGSTKSGSKKKKLSRKGSAATTVRTKNEGSGAVVEGEKGRSTMRVHEEVKSVLKTVDLGFQPPSGEAVRKKSGRGHGNSTQSTGRNQNG